MERFDQIKDFGTKMKEIMKENDKVSNIFQNSFLLNQEDKKKIHKLIKGIEKETNLLKQFTKKMNKSLKFEIISLMLFFLFLTWVVFMIKNLIFSNMS